MSLSRLRWAKSPLFLKFQGLEINVIDHQGKPWLLPEQIGRALELASPRKGVIQLYHRHRDEFGPDETAEIEMDVAHGGPDSSPQIEGASRSKSGESDPDLRPQSGDASRRKTELHTRRIKVRIFSLRGANHLAFFARTEVSKAFRQWVLDLIERSGEDQSFYRPYAQVWEYECVKHPRWAEISRHLTVNRPTAEIARELCCAPSTVRRAVNEMRRAGFIPEQEFQRMREGQRVYAAELRKIRAPKQSAFEF